MPLTETQSTTRTKLVLSLGGLGVAALALAVVQFSGGRFFHQSARSTVFTCPTVTDVPDLLTRRDTDNSALKAALTDGYSREVSNLTRQGNLAKSNLTKARLQEILQQRKQTLLATMVLDPASALSSALLDAERTFVGKITRGCVEKVVTVEGELQVEHIELLDGTSANRYFLEQGDGQTFVLHPAYDSAVLRSGMRIRVTGLQLDQHLLASVDASAPAPVPTAINIVSTPTIATIGVQKMLVLLAYFQDTPQPSVSVNTLYQKLFDPTTESTDQYFRETSYDRLWLTGVNNPRSAQGVDGDIYGWYRLNMNQVCPGVSQGNLLIEAAMVAAEADLGENGIDFTQYQHVLIFSPYSVSACGGYTGVAPGLGSLNTPDGTVSLLRAFVHADYYNSHIQTHEISHNLGNHHASSLNCGGTALAPSGCSRIEYGDRFDVLGSSSRHGHFNAPHKLNTGWLDGGADAVHEIRSIISPGTATYDLMPIEAQAPGLKALKIQRGTNDFLYVEFRQSLGFDQAINDQGLFNVYNGALLHIHGGGSVGYPAILYAQDSSVVAPRTLFELDKIAALTPGYVNPDSDESGFLDPVTGTRVRVLSTTIDAANPANSRVRVEVTLSPTADFVDPTVTLVPPTPTADASVSGVINVAAEATDNFAIDHVEFRIGSGALSDVVNVNLPTSGTTYTAQLNTSRVPNGTSSLSAKAYDTSGRSKLTSVFVTVANVDPNPPSVVFTAPTPGSTLTNPITFAADATDDVGVWKVEFYQGSATTPFTLNFQPPYRNTLSLTPGPTTLRARAYDLVGNWTEASVSFTILDTTPPTIRFLSPRSNATISEIYTFSVYSTDNLGVAWIELFVDSETQPFATVTPTGSQTNIPVDTRWFTNDRHDFHAKAYDAAGNVGETFSYEGQNVLVDNPPLPPRRLPPEEIAP
ncbi:MAG: hypothetical protein HYZ09_00595 [Candidatus Kerfeldbacteria bacterium]|nr:hypothetical protein [Candidatus Kerfeldbacteria bacterium]